MPLRWKRQETFRRTWRRSPDRPPQVWFVNFGESSLDFELLVWLGASSIRRPKAVTAAYLWEIHSALERHEIEVPFPQRDLHLKSYFGLSGERCAAGTAGRRATLTIDLSVTRPGRCRRHCARESPCRDAPSRGNSFRRKLGRYPAPVDRIP